MPGEPSDNPGVIVFPPALFGAGLGIGFAFQWLWPVRLLPGYGVRVVGTLILVGSVLLARWAQATMRRGGTNVNPNKPALALVATGPFRHTRNPLYIALSGLYVGLTLLADSVWPLLLLVPVLLVTHYGIVRREERYLKQKFGAPYVEYTTRVHRWF
jgi:protein-S-isoprenylcysteine O-methyltransferase Ste14